MEEVISCSSEDSIKKSLKDGKKVVIVTESNDLKGIDDKAKIYNSFKRIYSFKSELTIIKLTEDRKIDKLTENILLILFKTAKHQEVDCVYMPAAYKKMLTNDQFNKYQDIVKFMDGVSNNE